MTSRSHHRLVNLNRSLIVGLTVSGLLNDGLQVSDLSHTVAVIVWLWLPICTRLELDLMNWASRLRQSGSMVALPQQPPTN